MNEDKKIAVYLTLLDWQAVDRCLRCQVEGSTVDGKTLWNVGRERVQFIRERIAERIKRYER